MIPVSAYHTVWIIFLTFLCFWHSVYLSKFPSYEDLQYRSPRALGGALLLLLIVTLFFGLRPISSTFSDMVGYAASYKHSDYRVSEIRNEPIWQVIRYICKEWLGLSVHLWFLVVAAIPFALKFAACRKLLGNHIYTVFLFLLTSFSFWSNAVTIIRSNIGMSFALYGMVLYLEDTKMSKLWALLFFVLAFYTHTSSALLVGCFLIARYVFQNIKWSLFVYAVCILLSLLFGHFWENFFASLGFDDRMSSFTSNAIYKGFSHAGFRWDFLAYSIVPIIFGWYLVYVQKVEDKIYSILLNTYILSNAFWVLVIRAQFSDRFAAISWTLYFLVLAYPLLVLPLWNHQSRKVIAGLWFQMLFLWFMEFYYYAIR